MRAQPGELVTSAEAAALVGRPQGTVRCWTHRGLLKPVKTVKTRHYFRLADVLTVAAAMAAAPTANRNRPAPEREEDEPTEAELDELIAEQMRPENLPRWWPKHKGEAA